jgi:hypothetical protein
MKNGSSWSAMQSMAFPRLVAVSKPMISHDGFLQESCQIDNFLVKIMQKLMPNDTLQRLLNERFAAVDIDQAAEEVRVFLPDPRELDLWSQEFFMDLAGRIQTS